MRVTAKFGDFMLRPSPSSGLTMAERRRYYHTNGEALKLLRVLRVDSSKPQKVHVSGFLIDGFLIK